MPTVLLVSASLSLLLAADPDVEGGEPSAGHPDRSRKDILQLIILHLLKRLPDDDLVALYEFSARDTQCTVAFTNDHSAVRRRIYQMGVHERGLFGPAIEKLTDDLAYSFPLRTKVQVILFSDGPLSLGWDQCRFRPVDDEAQALESICALVQKIQDRYALHLSIVCLGDRREMPIIRDTYYRLAKAGRGQICHIELPGSNVKQQIDIFFERLFPIYTGSIQLGLETLVTFRADPDPHTIAWDPGLYWPPVLVVAGFLAADDAIYAIISRHSLYDAGAPENFAHLILALHRINRVVVIRLDRFRHWFAILRRVPPGNLVLDVLEPGAILPRFQSSFAACDFTTPLASSQAPDPSYRKAARDCLSLNPESVQRDVSKLVKLLQETDDDGCSAILTLIDDLRQRAERFHCPSLIDALSAILDSERSHLRSDVQARVLDSALTRLHA